MAKKWYSSKAVWGIVLVVLTGLGMYFLPDYGQFLQLIFTVGAALGIFGARVSTENLEL